MERIEGVTNEINKSWARWILPSLGDAIFLILFLFLIGSERGLLGDADTGWHIGIGRYILETGTIPRTGIYSYTAADMPWMSHEWLTELIFALVHNIGGLYGVVVLTALAIAATHSLFFGFLLYRGVNTVLAVILTIAVITTTSVHWLARPHILSMPITLVWYMALEAYRLEGKRYIYLLPLLTILWVNLHGGFMAGLLLIAVYWLGSLLDLFLSKDGNVRERGKKDLLVYSKVGLLAAAASLLNPHGYEALLFPFQIMTQEISVGRVEEWLSPNFHQFQPFEYMLLSLIVVLCFSLRKLRFIEAGLVILWTHLSLHSIRYTPIFAIIITPIIAVRLEGIMEEGVEGGHRLLNKIYAVSQRIQKTSESLNTHILPTIAVFFVLTLVICGSGTLGMSFGERAFDKEHFPIVAVDFAEKNGVKGRVFNTYHFGGYLIYQGVPKEGVFVDGRADMYNEFLKNYYDVVDVKPAWREVLERFDINWMLITANSPLSVLLLETEEWRLIYADKVANIFVKGTPENQDLINRYPDVKLVAKEEDNGSK